MAVKSTYHLWDGEAPALDFKNMVYRIEPTMSAIEFIALEEKVKSDIRKSNIKAKRNKTKLVLGGLHG